MAELGTRLIETAGKERHAEQTPSGYEVMRLL